MTAVVVFSIAQPTGAQDLITNGDFEIGPFDENGTVTGWSASALVTNTNENFAIGSHVAAFNVAGDSQGNTLSQPLSTSVGQWYQVVFESAIFNNTSSPLQLNVQISGGGTVLNRSVTPRKSNIFTTYRYSFRADSASSTIQFSDLGSGNGTTDTLLDNVSVTATPAPTAVPLPLVNGDFETGPSENGTVPGWTVEGSGDIAIESNEGTTQGSAYAAVFGVARDSQNNVLHQTFETINGETYNLDFDTGVFGIHSGGPLQFRVRVFDTATASPLLDQTVVPPEAGTFNGAFVAFNHYHFSFNAIGTTTRLEFSDIGTGAAQADVVVDSVSVAVATPTPTPTPIPTPTPTPTPVPTPTPTTLPLNNGSFETPPYMNVGTITGWTVSGNMNIAAIEEGATDGTHSAAFSAGANSQEDILSQQFVTSPGTTYDLVFDTAVYGTPTESNLQLSVKVLGNGLLLDEIFTPPRNAADPIHPIFQHYHFTFTADSAIATLQYTNFLLGNQNADIVLDKVSVVAQPPSYIQWRNAHFSAAQQNDSNVSGWSADPDNDRIANGLEYFSHTDPLAGITAADSVALTRATIENSGGSNYLTYTYRRLINWGGNTPVIAVADNVGTWDTSGNLIETVGNPVPVGDGITETIKVRLTTPLAPGLTRKFIQLQLGQ